jgi:hypothetical protein
MGLSGFGRRDRQIYSHGLLGKIVSSGIKSLGRRCHKISFPFSVATAHLIYDQIKSSMGAGRKWPLPQTLTGADLFSRFIIRLPRQLDTATLVCSGRASSMGAGRKWPSRRFPFPLFLSLARDGIAWLVRFCDARHCPLVSLRIPVSVSNPCVN